MPQLGAVPALQKNDHNQMNRPFNIFAVSFGVLACFIILWTDFKRAYFVEIPVLMLKNTIDQVVPVRISRHSSRGTPVHAMGSTLFTEVPKQSNSEYEMAPMISSVFALFESILKPLKPLPAGSMLFACQFLSMLAYIASVYMVVRLHEEDEHANMRTTILSFASLAFLPMVLCLKDSVVDLVVGILPLSIAYYFLVKRKPVRAGMTLAITLLKPQFLVPAIFLATAMVVDKKRQKCLIALTYTLALALVFDLLFFGGQLGRQLNTCLRLDFLAPTSLSILPTQLIASLPGCFVFLLSPASVEVLKPAIYCFAIFMGSLAFISALRLWQVRLKDEKRIGLTLILGIIIAPFVVPQFFIYDYCMYALAGVIVLSTQWSPGAYNELNAIMRLNWLVINLFCLPIFFNAVFAYPVALIFALLLFYRQLLIVSELMRTKESIPEVPIVERLC